MTTDGHLCGWRVRSELTLPELPSWRGEDRAPDIIVRLGPAPPRLEGGLDCDPFLQLSPDGACLLRLPDVGSFHVLGPGEVVVDAHPAATAAELRLFLLGSVLGYLCHLRGLFPLHASCVSIGGRAIAFSGASGAGKSTTAFRLAHRGHGLVADDVTVIDTSAEPRVLPSFPRLKLWQDSLDSLGAGTDGLERNRPGQSKFHVLSPAGFPVEPLPLAAIFMLSRSPPGSAGRVDRVTSVAEVVSALTEEVFRLSAARRMRRDEALFRSAAKIAGAVPVYRLSRPFDFDDMDRWLEAVETIEARCPA